MLIIVPLMGALVGVFLPKDRPRDAWHFALAVSFFTLVLSVLIFFRYDYSAGGFQFLRGRTFRDRILRQRHPKTCRLMDPGQAFRPRLTSALSIGVNMFFFFLLVAGVFALAMRSEQKEQRAT